jgi:hypothetical protein
MGDSQPGAVRSPQQCREKEALIDQIRNSIAVSASNSLAGVNEHGC